MSAVFECFMIPLLVGAAYAVGVLWRCKEKDARRQWLFQIILGVAVSVITFSALRIVQTLLFSQAINGAPLIFLLTSACVIAALFVPKGHAFHALRPRVCRFLKSAGVAALVCLLLEGLLFQANSICSSYSEQHVSPAASSLQGKFTAEQNTVIFNGDSTMTLLNDVNGVKAIGLIIDPTESAVHLAVSIKDDNFSAALKTVVDRDIATTDREVFVPIKCYGTLHHVTIAFSNVRDPLTVRSVVYANAMPPAVSGARFALMLGTCLAVLLVVHGRLHLHHYDRKRRSHKALVFLCFLVSLSVCVAMIIPVFKLEKPEIEYPFEGEAGSRDCYVQQFDAFQKGQLHLDITPTESLLAVENPYDHSLRHGEEAVYYQWDRAFYDGKYYSYFGVAPLSFYYLYYAVRDALPHVYTACGAFAMLAVCALYLLILRLVKMFTGKNKVNLLLLLMLLLAAPAVSGIYWFQIGASYYCVTLLSAIAFTCLAVWAGLKGYSSSHRVWQPLFLALCGIFVAMTAASRPTAMLFCLLLAPAFIHILVRKDYSVKHKAVSAASFLLPVCVGAGLLMMFNYLRFDSPFEFGSLYQLTVNDMRANTVSLSLLPAAFFHFFLQPVGFTAQFPYIRPMYLAFQNLGRYVYNEGIVGVFALPQMIAAGALWVPVARRTVKKQPVKCAMLIMAPVLAVVIAFLDFCVAGVHIRYIGDILPILTALSIPVLLEGYGRLDRIKVLRHRHFPLFALTIVLSVIICFGVGLHMAGYGMIPEIYPQLVAALQDVLIFWR